MNIITTIANATKKVIGYIVKAKKEIELSARLKKAMGIENGYTIETLKKFYSTAESLIAFYMALPIDSLKICITNGNKKIGHVMNVSLLPIFTCINNCQGCRFFCYDIKACMQYKNVIMARARNTVLLWRNRDKFFDLIDKKISHRRKNKYFRWHVAGDIIDLDYFERMVEIAKNHKDFVFWTYTKQYDIVNTYCDRYGKQSIPSNFSIMFSQWDGIEIVNPYGFAEFRVVDDIKTAKGFICPGNCEFCLKNRCGCPYQQTVTNEKH